MSIRMTQADPVNGNQSYTRVDAIASQLSNLSASDASIYNLTVGTINVVTVNASEQIIGAWKYITVDAYGTNAFSTIGVGAAQTLVNTPNLLAPSSIDDPSIVRIPSGAQVLSIIVDDMGTTIAPPDILDIGLVPVSSGLNAAPTQNLLAGAASAEMVLSDGGLAAGRITTGVVDPSVAAPALGSAGDRMNDMYGPVVTAAADSVLSVENAGGPAKTAGALRVEVTYRVAAL